MSDTPIILRDVFLSKSGMFDANQNFADLENRIFFFTPDSSTIVGPPTSDTWAVNETWIDSLHALFVCTVAGTPGSWKQVIAAVVTSNPIAPVGYEIVRSDQERRRFRYNGSTWDRINRKVFNQVSPASVWGPFTHGFGYVPSRVALWVGGKEVLGGITADSNTAQADFDSALSGTMIVE